MNRSGANGYSVEISAPTDRGKQFEGRRKRVNVGTAHGYELGKFAGIRGACGSLEDEMHRELRLEPRRGIVVGEQGAG